MEAYLAIDIGTTNWKVAAFDSNADLIAIEKKRTVTHRSGQVAFYDAQEIWGTVCDLLKKIMPRLTGYHIRSVACTGMAESVVALGKDDRVLYRVESWFSPLSVNCTREISQRFTNREIFRKTGLDVHPMFVLSRWLYMKSADRSLAAECKILLQLPEFITYKLCGKAYTDYSLASRTMLFNLSMKDWDDELLAFAGLRRDQLPHIVQAGTFLGTVDPAAAQSTGLPLGTAIAMGGHDHPCATIATNVATGAQLLDSSGTAESFLYVSSKGDPLPAEWAGLRVCRHLDGDRYVLWGGIPAGGATVDWAIRQYKNSIDTAGTFPAASFSYQDFCETYLASIPAGCNGLIFLPHLRGAGAPYWNSQARGAYIGLTDKHTPQEMMKAVFEGLAFQTRLIKETIEAVSDNKLRTYNTVGGGARLQYWQQIKSEICSTDIQFYANNEATLAGCAFLGAVAVQDVATIEDAALICSKKAERIMAPQSPIAVYEKIYPQYVLLNNRLCSLL